MLINVLSFGVAKDIVGHRNIKVECNESTTVKTLKERLFADYPDLSRLKRLAIAVNDEYVGEDTEILERDEIVLIPPVSGG